MDSTENKTNGANKMQNITIESVKALYSNGGFVALVADVRRRQADAARIRKVVDGYTLPVFEGFDLVDEFTGAKIESMSEAWKASEDTSGTTRKVTHNMVGSARKAAPRASSRPRFIFATAS